jgi:hypothetical protein
VTERIRISQQFVTEYLLTLEVTFTSVQYGCPWLCGKHPGDTVIRPTVFLVSDFYQSYSVNNPVAKLLGWKSTGMDGMYTSPFINHQNKKCMGFTSGDMGDQWMQRPRRYLVQVPRHVPGVVGMGPILLQNNTVYIQLWNQEVIQHINRHVTHNGSLGLQHRKHGP